MILPLPKGYTPPDSARPGEPFEAVARIKANDDGSFELLTIDGSEIGGDDESQEAVPDDEAAEEEQDPMSKFAAKIPLPWNQKS